MGASRARLSKLAAEAIGTFVLVFAGCGAGMVSERFGTPISGAGVALVFGLAVAAMIYAVGHISGAHFNPAVTLGFAVARQLPKKQVLGYWAAQLAGAVAASALLWWLLPAGRHYGATFPAIAPLKAVVCESVLTFILMFVIIAVATDTRAEGTMAGAAIGATVVLCALVGGPVTGAALNPARALAPALFEGGLSVAWIYIVGPFAGAALAALTYEQIKCESNDTSAKGCC